MIHERSAGIVPFYETETGRKYLLLLSKLTLNEHWEFPKGQIEEGETPETAAGREFVEETGIATWEMIPGFEKTVQYFYRRPGRLISKTVVYFLGRARSTSVQLSRESKGYEWLSFEEAMNKLFHQTMKETLTEAENFLRCIK